MAVDMHNASTLAWEPFLEPFGFDVNCSLVSGPKPSSDVRLHARRPCNVNVSVPICELLSSSVVTLVEDVMRKPAEGLDELSGPSASSFSPFSVVNETGIPLYYGRAGAGPPQAMLVPGEQHSFSFWPELFDRLQLCSPSGPPPCALAFGFDTWTPIESVRIDRVGRRVLTVSSTAAKGVSVRLICETTLLDDVKCVRLTSTTRLRNETRELLCVRVGHPHQASETVHPLKPGESLPMPPQHGSFAYRVCMRPMDGDFEWSAQCTIPADDGTTQPPASASLRCRRESNSMAAWHCTVHHDGRQQGVCEVRLTRGGRAGP